MKFCSFYFLLLLFNFSCAQNSSKPITEVSRNELNNVIVLDVRTPEEFEAGHIENALNIDWFDEDFTQKIEAIDKNETIYIYCEKGGRSAKAAVLLDSLGYKNTINLLGGFDAYSQK